MIDNNSDNSNLDQDNDEPIVTWSDRKWWSKGLTIILLLAIIICIAATVYIINTGHSSEPFTEFYILGPDGKADNYPTDLKLGEDGQLILGIVNHEYNRMNYNVDIEINGKVIHSIKSIDLDNEAKWENKVAFKPDKTGQNQKVEFILYKQNEINPYLKLNLIINVN